MYPIIHFLGRDIGVYALLAVAGLIAAAFVTYFLTKKIGLHSEDIVLLTLVVAAGVLVGGHILYGMTQYRAVGLAVKCLFEGKSFDTVLGLLQYAFGGSVFYGGLIMAFLFFRFAIRKKPSYEKAVLTDALAVAIPLFHFFGRIGCFFGGCCYGIESSFGFIIENNDLVPDLCGVRRFPVSLFEAGFNLLIFFVLLYLAKKERCQGKLVWLYGIMYPIVRFTLEFFRGDLIRGIYFGLSTSQWISIILFIISVCMLIKGRKQKIAVEQE